MYTMKIVYLTFCFLFFTGILRAQYTQPSSTTSSGNETSSEVDEESDEEDSEDKDFDIQVFSGTNLDPGNSDSPITNFSFEGLIKGKISEKIFFRFGGYSNRNFSRDSASGLPQTRYILVDPAAGLKVDTSRLVQQRYQFDTKLTTRSVGFYFDILYDVYHKDFGKNKVRISAVLTPELIIRRRESEIKVTNSSFGDTILFDKRLLAQNIVASTSAVTSDNVYVPKYKIDQGFLKFGPALEISNEKYELFFYPSYSYVLNRVRSSFIPGNSTSQFGSLNVKVLANIKLLGIQFGLDAKSLLTDNAYYNLSIGIPLGLNAIKEKISNE
jgi:hypothetical protein